MKSLIRIISVLFTLIFFLLAIVTAIDIVAVDSVTYRKVQINNDIAQTNNISQTELDDITHEITAFIKGDRQDFDILDGTGSYELFNDREKQHMFDVRDIFKKATSFQVIAICILFSMIIAVLIAGTDKTVNIFTKSVLITCLFIVIFIISIVIFMNIDFYGFWNMFHELIFVNDLYIMYPETDFIINIMPLEFFTGMSLYALSYFGLFFGTFFAIIFGINIKNRTKKKNAICKS